MTSESAPTGSILFLLETITVSHSECGGTDGLRTVSQECSRERMHALLSRKLCEFSRAVCCAPGHTQDNDIRNDEGASGGNGDCRPTQYLSDHRMSMTDIRTTVPLVRFATTTSMM